MNSINPEATYTTRLPTVEPFDIATAYCVFNQVISITGQEGQDLEKKLTDRITQQNHQSAQYLQKIMLEAWNFLKRNQNSLKSVTQIQLQYGTPSVTLPNLSFLTALKTIHIRVPSVFTIDRRFLNSPAQIALTSFPENKTVNNINPEVTYPTTPFPIEPFDLPTALYIFDQVIDETGQEGKDFKKSMNDRMKHTLLEEGFIGIVLQTLNFLNQHQHGLTKVKELRLNYKISSVVLPNLSFLPALERIYVTAPPVFQIHRRLLKSNVEIVLTDTQNSGL